VHLALSVPSQVEQFAATTSFALIEVFAWNLLHGPALCSTCNATSAEAEAQQTGGLIVVASLISKVPNLGGLARTAEVFGAQALVLADKRVTQQAGFTG